MVPANTDTLCTVRGQVNDMNKKIVFILTLIFTLLMFSLTYADGGSIIINCSGYEANFSIYKIADEKGETENAFEELNIDFSDIKTAEDMNKASENILEYISDNNISYNDSKKGMNGISFDCPEKGIYFLRFNKTGNVNMESFFVAIPTYDSENNIYLYDVTINAKVDKDGGGSGGDDDTETTTSGGGTANGGGGGGSRPSGNKDENTDNGTYADDDTDINTDDSSTEDDGFDTETGPGTEPVTEKDNNTPQDTDDPSVIEDTTESNAEIETTPDGTPVTLPKTGGDKTVLICYYCGATALALGIAILIINNVKRRKETQH